MKPRPSRYNGAILKKFGTCEKLSFSAFNWDAAKSKSVFAVWEALLKLADAVAFRKRAVGFRERAVAS